MRIALLAASGVAQEHEHGKGEKLGAVHFATSCNAEAQKEFDRAVAAAALLPVQSRDSRIQRRAQK